jgi:hypothetical protein
MPDFTNFKIFEKFIIPTLHAWKIEYLGNNVVNARVVDENGVAYDAENEKPTVALCLAVEKMAQG